MQFKLESTDYVVWGRCKKQVSFNRWPKPGCTLESLSVRRARFNCANKGAWGGRKAKQMPEMLALFPIRKRFTLKFLLDSLPYDATTITNTFQRLRQQGEPIYRVGFEGHFAEYIYDPRHI